MTKLRVLSAADFELIKALFKEAFTAPPRSEDWSDDGQLNEYLLYLINVRTPLLLGLYDGGEAVGISVGNIRHWCSGTEYFIEELCIRPGRQGQGLGREFFRLIKEHLTGIGINQIYLNTERELPACGFYRHLGFTELTGHTSFFTEF